MKKTDCLHWALSSAAVLWAILLTACGQSGGSHDSAIAAIPPAAISSTHTTLPGVLHGGQAPIVGSSMTLYAAGVPASAAPTLLNTTITDSSGNFSLKYTCPSAAALVYVVAVGGNAGGGNNPAIKLMAALGPCGSLPAFIVVNELTTVAAVYALNAFSTIAATSGGIGGCVDCQPGSDGDMTQLHGNTPAIGNSFGTAALLANVATGSPATFLPSSATCGSATPLVNCSALGRLTALGNSLAACVNSAAGSAQCTSLFGFAPATDTLGATLYLARNPGLVNTNGGVAGIFALSTRNVVFSPGLSAAPTDWTVAVNFIGGGFNYPVAIAIDASGNAWVANYNGNSVTELSAIGVPQSPANVGFTGGGLSGPRGIAIDTGGNVWTANLTNNSVTELSSAGLPISPAGGFVGGGLNVPRGIAIDGGGNIWVANYGNNSVTELSSTGIALTPATTGLGGGYFNKPWNLAVDRDNNVWVANSGSNSVGVLVGVYHDLVAKNPILGGGLTNPLGIAIDANNNVWVANNANPGSVTEIGDPDPAYITSSPTSNFTGGGLFSSQRIAVDGNGNAWVTNTNAGSTGTLVSSVSEISSTGSALSPATSGFTGGGLSGDVGIAIDGGGNVWVTNVVNNSVTEIIGAAAPAITPLVAQITKPAAALSALTVTPASGSITNGNTQQFTAVATYADNSTKTVTGQVTWVSATTSIATITSAGLATCIAPGTVNITANLSQGGVTAPTATAVLTCVAPVVTLSSVSVTPATASIAANATQQFTATGTYSDASIKDLTSTVAWTTSNAAVATISSPGGLATGVAAGGPITVSATVPASGQTAAVTGSAQLTVTALASALTCNAAPSPVGGGALPFENEAYCITFTGQTDQLYSFTATLTFTTPLAAGNLIGCQYASTGTVTSTSTPASTGPTACTGTLTVSSTTGNFSIVDSTVSTNTFTGTFSTLGNVASGTYNFGVFGPGGGIAAGSFSGPVVP